MLRQVTTTNFPVRAEGLANEILEKEPDLVGLQEVALWRTGPASLTPLTTGVKTATTVRYDFLQLLLDELNAGEPRYEVVVVQNEFDFEAPANENTSSSTGPPPIQTADLNGRLTMRDVILRRLDSGVRVANAEGDSFDQLLTLPILGAPVAVTRGWTAVDAKVRGGDWFRFVNTHLEAFDPRTVVPSLRSLQALELVADGGPADSELPVVLLGDLNSDDDTVVPGDQQAYRALLDAGLVERSTNDPLSCCVSSFNLQTGSVTEFDHQVDHVMTDSPKDVTLVSSSVTGLREAERLLELRPRRGLQRAAHQGPPAATDDLACSAGRVDRPAEAELSRRHGVHRRRREVRPLHGPLHADARSGARRCRRRRRRDARPRRRLRPGRADGRAGRERRRGPRRGDRPRPAVRGRVRGPASRAPTCARASPSAALGRRHVRRDAVVPRHRLHDRRRPRRARDGARDAARRHGRRVHVGHPRRRDDDAPARSGRPRARSIRASPASSPAPGVAQGDIADRFRRAGLQDVEDGALEATADYTSFEDFWEPFTYGVGPAGQYLASLPAETSRSASARRAATRCPSGAFTLTARAWYARGTAPAYVGASALAPQPPAQARRAGDRPVDRGADRLLGADEDQLLRARVTAV